MQIDEYIQFCSLFDGVHSACHRVAESGDRLRLQVERSRYLRRGCFSTFPVWRHVEVDVSAAAFYTSTDAEQQQQPRACEQQDDVGVVHACEM